MRMMRLAGGAAVLVAALAALPSRADMNDVKTVHFAACTMAGVEYGCVIAKGDDGVIYNVNNAAPYLKPNQWLQGTAFITDRASYCMQGKTIDNFVPDKDQKPVSCGD